MSLARFSVVALALSFVAACAATPDTDDSADTDSASTIGSRWRSPLSNGIYDGDQGTLVVYSDTLQSLTSQIISVDETRSGRGLRCHDVDVDVTDGAASAHQGPCNVSLKMSGTTAIELDGIVDGTTIHRTYARRRPDALKGTYRSTSSDSPGHDIELQIDASSDDALTLSLRFDGAELASHATATRLQASLAAWLVDLDGCRYVVSFLRYDGRYVPSVYGDIGTDTNTCPVDW